MTKNFLNVLFFSLMLQVGRAQTECLLVSPFLGDTISTSQPFFSWIDSGGQSNADRYSYRLFIIKQDEQQNNMQTLENNLPIYQSEDFKQSQWHYPADAPILSNGTYLWKIEKYQMNVLVDKSALWMFVIHHEDKKSTRKTLKNEQ